jgi:anti-sigma regulatory factor (Ser/Thr protein kinase)
MDIITPGWPAGPGGHPGPVGPLGAPGGSAGPILDLAFDSGSLSGLRAAVKAFADRAGLPERRAQEVVIAVHELAANAVHHGAGAGRLRVWNPAGVLHCQVEDGDLLASSEAPLHPLPILPGHGLWVARHVADQLRVLSGARGTCATVTFGLREQP